MVFVLDVNGFRVRCQWFALLAQEPAAAAPEQTPASTPAAPDVVLMDVDAVAARAAAAEDADFDFDAAVNAQVMAVVMGGVWSGV